MKELIDYFNEKYTKKKEYICKDLKSSIIKKIELEKMLKPEIAIEGESFFYWKINNINIENLEAVINTFYNGSLAVSEKDIIIKGETNEDKTETYFIFDVLFIKIEDILIMYVPCEEIGEEGTTLQLSIIKNSISLPKLEYPKNKMDMYRAMSFICGVNNYIGDTEIENLIHNINFLPPKNIDEIDLYLDSSKGYLFKNIELKINAQYMNVEEFIGENWGNDIPKPSDKGWCIDLPLGVYFLPDKVIFEKNEKDKIFNKYSNYSLGERYMVHVYETDDFYVFRDWENFVLKMIFFNENIDLSDTILKCTRYLDLASKGFYYINPNKDNYYTILNAIKEGKTISYKYKSYPNWEINKEEKSIWIKKLGTFTETRFEEMRD